MSAKEQSLRDKLRAKTLGSSKRKEETVEIDGDTFIVRQPTVAERALILRKSGATSGEADKVDIAEMQVWAVIQCVYTPDGERVFEEADYEALRNAPTGSYVDKLAAEALRLMNVAEVEGKN